MNKTIYDNARIDKPGIIKNIESDIDSILKFLLSSTFVDDLILPDTGNYIIKSHDIPNITNNQNSNEYIKTHSDFLNYARKLSDYYNSVLLYYNFLYSKFINKYYVMNNILTQFKYVIEDTNESYGIDIVGNTIKLSNDIISHTKIHDFFVLPEPDKIIDDIYYLYEVSPTHLPYRLYKTTLNYIPNKDYTVVDNNLRTYPEMDTHKFIKINMDKANPIVYNNKVYHMYTFRDRELDVKTNTSPDVGQYSTSIDIYDRMYPEVHTSGYVEIMLGFNRDDLDIEDSRSYIDNFIHIPSINGYVTEKPKSFQIDGDNYILYFSYPISLFIDDHGDDIRYHKDNYIVTNNSNIVDNLFRYVPVLDRSNRTYGYLSSDNTWNIDADYIHEHIEINKINDYLILHELIPFKESNKTFTINLNNDSVSQNTKFYLKNIEGTEIEKNYIFMPYRVTLEVLGNTIDMYEIKEENSLYFTPPMGNGSRNVISNYIDVDNDLFDFSWNWNVIPFVWYPLANSIQVGINKFNHGDNYFYSESIKEAIMSDDGIDIKMNVHYYKIPKKAKLITKLHRTNNEEPYVHIGKIKIKNSSNELRYVDIRYLRGHYLTETITEEEYTGDPLA